jgi:phosphatidylglycerophosphatase A
LGSRDHVPVDLFFQDHLLVSAALRAASPMLARLIATWFGCGYSPVAPGTVGTVGALPLVYALARLGTVPYWVGTLVITALGVWASDRHARKLGEKDPSSAVIDEVSGTLIAVGFELGSGWLAIAAAVLLFRLFDIWKPGPVNTVQKLPGGFGVMADDVLAGILAGGVAALGALAAKTAL